MDTSYGNTPGLICSKLPTPIGLAGLNSDLANEWEAVGVGPAFGSSML